MQHHVFVGATSREKQRKLRAKLETGLQSLDRGEGRQLNIADIITRARAQHVREQRT